MNTKKIGFYVMAYIIGLIAGLLVLWAFEGFFTLNKANMGVLVNKAVPFIN